MSEQGAIMGGRTKESNVSAVWQVMVFSLFLLGALVVTSCYLYDWSFARSILIGGLLVNSSFWLLKKDAQRLIQKLGEAGGDSRAGINFEKTRFLLRSFARLIALGLLLFALASQVAINVIGLTLGFATVMVSVVIIGLSAGKCLMPSKV
jgi:hypothetical protein